MSAQQQTYYGPVATQGSTSIAVDTQSQGSLGKIVLQNIEVQNNNGIPQLTENWKGAWQDIKNLPLTTFKKGIHRSSISFSSNYVYRFNPPALSGDYDWQVVQATANQLDSGNHGTLTVVYKKTDNDSSSTPQDELLPGYPIWTLTYGSEYYPVEAYCSNNISSDESAKWINIEDWLNQPTETHDAKKRFMCTSIRGVKSELLNEHERWIAKKVLEGKTQVARDYPIIECTMMYDKMPGQNAGWNGLVLPYINLVDNDFHLPVVSNNPFESIKQYYAWLLIRNDITVNPDGTVICVRQWAGSLRATYGGRGWDSNFYLAYGQTPPTEPTLSGYWTLGSL